MNYTTKVVLFVKSQIEQKVHTVKRCIQAKHDFAAYPGNPLKALSQEHFFQTDLNRPK